MVDALGSVTGTVNQSARCRTPTATSPTGRCLPKTGTAADPKMQWVGSLGYRATTRRQSDYYVRARHYGSLPGMWTTVDPLWPTEPAVAYASARPTLNTDPSGLYDPCGEIAQHFGDNVESCKDSGALPIPTRYRHRTVPSWISRFRTCDCECERSFGSITRCYYERFYVCGDDIRSLAGALANELKGLEGDEDYDAIKEAYEKVFGKLAGDLLPDVTAVAECWELMGWQDEPQARRRQLEKLLALLESDECRKTRLYNAPGGGTRYENCVCIETRSKRQYTTITDPISGGSYSTTTAWDDVQCCK